MINDLKVVREKDSLVISGLDEAGIEETWSVASFKEEFLFARKHGQTSTHITGACFSSVDGLIDFLSGVHFRRWDGGIHVDTGYGRKKLYFRNGELVFAASDLIDDRLGEVSYRQGLITLDELTESATKVSRRIKFGQVLVRSNVFTDFQLWNALKEQIRQIVKSLFMVESVYFELDSSLRVPFELIFSEGTSNVLESCYGYGSMFRSFVATLKDTSTIRVLNSDQNEGFLGDLIEIIGKKSLVTDFINQSKLQQPYTLAALMELVNRGICAIEDTKQRTVDENHPKLSLVRKYLKAYEVGLKIAIAAFESEKESFPVADFRALVDSFNQDMPVFYLDASANISTDSVNSIYSQCFYIKGRSEFFEVRLKSLVEFLIQVTGDHLTDAVVKQIRDSIRDYL